MVPSCCIRHSHRKENQCSVCACAALALLTWRRNALSTCSSAASRSGAGLPMPYRRARCTSSGTVAGDASWMTAGTRTEPIRACSPSACPTLAAPPPMPTSAATRPARGSRSFPAPPGPPAALYTCASSPSSADVARRPRRTSRASPPSTGQPPAWTACSTSWAGTHSPPRGCIRTGMCVVPSVVTTRQVPNACGALLRRQRRASRGWHGWHVALALAGAPDPSSPQDRRQIGGAFASPSSHRACPRSGRRCAH